MPIGHFLGGIAAVIWEASSGKYLLLRRSGQRDFQAGAWECVTGRVDQGESYEQALYREVREEIGVDVQIEFIIAATHFYRGAPIPENELLGIIYGCTIPSRSKPKLSFEHSEMRWGYVTEANDLLPEGHWLRDAINRAELLKDLLPEQLRGFFRSKGLTI